MSALPSTDWFGVGVSVLLAGLLGFPLVWWAIRWAERDDADVPVAEEMSDLDAEYERLVDEAAALDEVLNLLGPPPGWSPVSDDDLLLIAQIAGVRQ